MTFPGTTSALVNSVDAAVPSPATLPTPVLPRRLDDLPQLALSPARVFARASSGTTDVEVGSRATSAVLSASRPKGGPAPCTLTAALRWDETPRSRSFAPAFSPPAFSPPAQLLVFVVSVLFIAVAVARAPATPGAGAVA